MTAKRKELEAKVTQLRSEIAFLRSDLTDEVEELDRRRRVAIQRMRHMAVAGIGVGIGLMVIKSLVTAVLSIINDLPKSSKKA